MILGGAPNSTQVNIFRGLGIATFVLLPVWGAMFNLRPTEMPWVGLSDLICTSVAVSIYFFGITRLQGKVQLVMAVPFVLLFILIGYDALLFIYDSLRAELRHFGILEHYKEIFRTIFWLGIFSIPLLIWFIRYRILVTANEIGTLFGILFVVLVAQFAYTKIFSINQVDIRQTINVTPKTVVLIFDELDADLLDAKIQQFPTFHYLEKNATLLGRVYPPSNYTHISVPSMLVGKPLQGIEINGKSIIFTPKGESRTELLPTKDDLLSIAVEKGLRVSLIGWHLPYCAAFTKISRCLDDAHYGVPGYYLSTMQWVYGKSALLFKYRESQNIDKFNDINVYSEAFFRDPRNLKRNTISKFIIELDKRLKLDVASKDYNLIFAHLPCPHLPRLDGKLTQGLMTDYYDNMLQCDRLLATVKAALDKVGDQPWRMIVTSDHWFRPADWIRNKKPNDHPLSPRKVPFYFVESGFKGAPMRVSDGSNIRLAQIYSFLITAGFGVAESINLELQKYGADTVILNKF